MKLVQTIAWMITAASVTFLAGYYVAGYVWGIALTVAVFAVVFAYVYGEYRGGRRALKEVLGSND